MLITLSRFMTSPIKTSYKPVKIIKYFLHSSFIAHVENPGEGLLTFQFKTVISKRR